MNGVLPAEKTVSRALVVAVALLGVGLLGFLDYITGRDLTITAFYLIPISWSAWMVGRGAGVVLSFASALTWLAGDLLTAVTYPLAAMPYWNALMLMALFLPTVYLLSAFQGAHRHLEETVKLRTAALRSEIEERKRLESAKIQAERLAVVGTMAAQVAHEVRNPLGAITLNLDLLESEIKAIQPGLESSEGVVLVGEMREEVRRIDHVISDYLTLARPRVSHREALSLAHLIQRKVSFMQEVVAQSGVELRMNLKDTRPIHADADQIWQAILNLLRNSLEAMPDGGVLSISSQEQDGVVVLRLADTGSGMSEQQLGRLFVPFATTKANGTGLGLPLVQQIVTDHQGQIECASQPGGGTTFTLSLPISADSVPVQGSAHFSQTLAHA